VAQLTGPESAKDLAAACAGEPECPGDDGLITSDMVKDLGWVVGQIQQGYLGAAAAAVDSVPGGPRGLYVLGAALSDRAPNQIEIARRFGIDRTVMVHLIDQMEKAGLVERRPDPADRRARRIVGTRRGRAAYDEAQARLRLVEDHVLAPLSADERSAFAGMARRVVEHLISADPSQVEAACQAASAELDRYSPLT
jgi:DNA-binding MarR family transcriptional regulator